MDLELLIKLHVQIVLENDYYKDLFDNEIIKEKVIFNFNLTDIFSFDNESFNFSHNNRTIYNMIK